MSADMLKRLCALCILTVAHLSVATAQQGVHLLETKTEAELVGLLRRIIRPATIVGIWIDPRNPCGLIAVTTRNQKFHQTGMCSDGSTTERFKPLEAFRQPTGAIRAWRTPGLTRREIAVLGSPTVEYVDKNGERHDMEILVERRDGRLYAYQDGIGLDGDKPWMVGRRVGP